MDERIVLVDGAAPIATPEEMMGFHKDIPTSEIIQWSIDEINRLRGEGKRIPSAMVRCMVLAGLIRELQNA